MSRVGKIEDLPHMTLTEKPMGRLAADCAICHMGIECPPSFGGIPQHVMVAEWFKQHRHGKAKK